MDKYICRFVHYIYIYKMDKSTYIFVHANQRKATPIPRRVGLHICLPSACAVLKHVIFSDTIYANVCASRQEATSPGNMVSCFAENRRREADLQCLSRTSVSLGPSARSVI